MPKHQDKYISNFKCFKCGEPKGYVGKYILAEPNPNEFGIIVGRICDKCCKDSKVKIKF